MTNRVVRYRPKGGTSLTADDFAIETTDEPVAGAGKIVVEVDWLSVDPYMYRALMGLEKSMPPIPAGEPMTGRVIARVVDGGASPHKPGDHVLCFSPWQDRAAVDLATVIPVDVSAAEAPAYLGALGQSGITAWAGIFKVGALKAGETLVISAAGGAVGSVAGQLAKRHGCRVVGIAGGAEKCRHVVEVLGFDACIDYRAADFAAQLASALPDGVDVYLENVGGALFDTVLGHMNDYGRIAVCGLIAHYEKALTVRVENLDRIMAGALRIEAFRAKDFVGMRAEAVATLVDAYGEGRLKYDLTRHRGIASAPAALVQLLNGPTLGKTVVEIDR